MASGNTMAVFTALDAQPPASGYATIDTNNSHLVVSFAAAVDSDIFFEGVLPRNYAGGGLILTLWWLAASANSGTVQWEASIERHQDGTTNLTADDFAAAQTAAPSPPGTAGIVKATTITFTSGAQMDSLIAGESFRLKIHRESTGDTMTGAAQLLALELKES